MGSKHLLPFSRWRRFTLCVGLLSFLLFVRTSKGSIINDLFSLISKPFWPGTSQREWIIKGQKIEQLAKLQLLEQDNERLREILSLDTKSSSSNISAAVISRSPRGWWHQIQIGKGKSQGIEVGDSVSGPGGLLGIVESVTPITSRVRLLTAPGSRIGVWISRTKTHGILLRMGTNRPQINFLETNPNVLPGDLISTSPASTLLAPNLTIGIIQSINKDALPSPNALVQLTASPEAIDWVLIKKN